MNITTFSSQEELRNYVYKPVDLSLIQSMLFSPYPGVSTWANREIITPLFLGIDRYFESIEMALAPSDPHINAIG